MLILVEALRPLFLIASVLAGLALLVLACARLDRWASCTPEEALDDLRRYGPLAAGLRVELLPEEERWAVEAARSAHGTTDWLGRRVA